MQWVVYPKCLSSNQTTLFLTDGGADHATVTTAPSAGSHRKNQMWTPIFSVPANGFVLKNADTGRLLQYSNGQANTTFTDDTCTSETTTGQPTCVLNVGGQNSSGVAIRPTSNTTQNLNVSGNGPYNSGNAVLFFEWCGGQANEVWTFECVNG